MDLAFITTLKPQNGSFYGAETSLKFLISGIRDFDKAIVPYLIIRQSMIPSRKLTKVDLSIISDFFSIPIERIMLVWIPYITFPIEPKNTKSVIRWVITNILEVFFRVYLNKIFSRFDHVHINNTHLYLCTKSMKGVKFSQHIRDSINHPNLLSSKSNFFIAIDDTTFKKLPEKWKPKTSIILNSYSVNTKPEISQVLKEIRTRYSNVFCIVGQLAPIKGVDYVIREFISAKVSESALLVVGSDQGSGFKGHLAEIVNSHPDVYFTGSLSSVSQVYESSDYQIRGDEYFCIGRTTIEATCHGLTNILPCRVCEEVLFQNDQLSQAINNSSVFYNARDEGSLSELIRSCVSRPKKKRVLLGYEMVTNNAELFLRLITQNLKNE